MHKKPTVIPALWLALGAVVLIHGAGPALAQKRKPKKEEAAELEKKLLTLPAEPLDRDWQKTWQQHLLISFLNDQQGHRLAIGVTNQSPCTIKVLSTNVDHLVKDGRGKFVPPWNIPPWKKLYAGTRPGWPMVAIKNNLSGSVIGGLDQPFDVLCQIEVLPNDPEAKPLALVVVHIYGTDFNGQFIAGDYYLCRPEDKDQVQKAIGKH